ncbi:Glutamate 5-kinase [Acidisarcina polymorpha]|uniref:Glutamate 5-kinase n=1 Tax=Acidisarcina polymorpha TaxID=2211140 RepID=A0A2Z5G573_9BACT|nr:glutamate 5-kinase [Acidisarcina polymorpha]AXC14373.1 Glutamate 5-kinase [Acidisarcina polymorpha]
MANTLNLLNEREALAEAANVNAARERVASARRIVIKLGTNVIIRDDGAPAVGLIHALVESAINLRRDGKHVIFVSSGAIALGVRRLGMESSPTELAMKQACAAVGQSQLMSLYESGFQHFDVATAQVLLTEDDFLDPVRYSNLRATLETLLTLGVVPVINENDTVSTLELERPGGSPIGRDFAESQRIFGDNDKLSALVMTKMDADLLILLSDVSGLYSKHPSDPEAELISEVNEITPELIAAAGAANGRGRGGMLTKVEAARMVMDAGKLAIIASGRTPGVVERVCAGETAGTVFFKEGSR